MLHVEYSILLQVHSLNVGAAGIGSFINYVHPRGQNVQVTKNILYEKVGGI